MKKSSRNKQFGTRGERREKRKGRGQRHDVQASQFNPLEDVTEFTPRQMMAPLEARTEAQGHYIMSINTSKLTFGAGPAGTGKTYVCGAMAAEALTDKVTEKIILTRPAVEAGENLGFLPGDLSEKFEPYLQPFRDVLYERMGKGCMEYMVKSGRIEAAPLAYMRGRTFKDCWVILDEAQNVTPTQMKMFLTRIGDNCKVIVNGDPRQQDIAGMSGFVDAIDRLSYLNKVSVVEFCNEDIVRSGLVQQIVKAYER